MSTIIATTTIKDVMGERRLRWSLNGAKKSSCSADDTEDMKIAAIVAHAMRTLLAGDVDAWARHMIEDGAEVNQYGVLLAGPQVTDGVYCVRSDGGQYVITGGTTPAYTELLDEIGYTITIDGDMNDTATITIVQA